MNKHLSTNIDIDLAGILGPVASHGSGWSIQELQQLADALSQLPARSVRIANPNRDLPFETTCVPWYPRGRFVNGDDVRPGGYLQFLAGDYYIQDAGSMLPLALLDIEPGQRVCDTCAAPGGKATGILEQLSGHGCVIANEVIQTRIPVLELALARSGFSNYGVTRLEVEDLAAVVPEFFHRVLVDAPCTGQSMVARGKQTMSAFCAESIEHNAARQRRILEAASRLLKPGGKLIYSTCTFSFAENEGVVGEFLRNHPGWTTVADSRLGDWESPVLPGSYRLWPHRDRCSGGFAVAIQRPSAEVPNVSDDRVQQGHRTEPRRKRRRPESSAALNTRQLEWLAEESRLLGDAWEAERSVISRGRQFHLLPRDLLAESDAMRLISRLTAAVPLATSRGERLEPLFAAGVVADPRCVPRQTLELSDQQAVDYVAGHSVSGRYSENGWCVVTWRGRSLGWSKLTRSRMQNHFPKPLRPTGAVMY